MCAGAPEDWAGRREDAGGECFKEENVDFMHLCSFPAPLKLFSPVVWVKREQQ